MEKNSLLRHNEIDSLIRRPAGLTDAEWDFLICTAIDNSWGYSETTIFKELVLALLTDKNNKAYQSILKSLGIEGAVYQNWEHSAYRFFRHFCPEDFRNAMAHSGLPHARLTFNDDRQYQWESILKFHITTETELLEQINAKKGDEITIVAFGGNDVLSISIDNDREKVEYYSKDFSTSFGDMMYRMKKTIIANKKKRR